MEGQNWSCSWRRVCWAPLQTGSVKEMTPNSLPALRLLLVSIWSSCFDRRFYSVTVYCAKHCRGRFPSTVSQSSLSHTHAHSHSRSRSHSHTRTLTLTLTHSLTLSSAHALTAGGGDRDRNSGGQAPVGLLWAEEGEPGVARSAFRGERGDVPSTLRASWMRRAGQALHGAHRAPALCWAHTRVHVSL